jgi:hypothetical protein
MRKIRKYYAEEYTPRVNGKRTHGFEAYTCIICVDSITKDHRTIGCVRWGWDKIDGKIVMIGPSVSCRPPHPREIDIVDRFKNPITSQ